uniref:DUF2721 domain-containing protein n=1 Tax=Chlorobium chlorochromatii (strain CaD3) TaxID=340177 RepID=Q3ARJ6_CHLCH
MTIKELVPLLQTAIGPMILVSGLGLLLLSMTNRLGRIIDRSRTLLGCIEASAEPQVHRINREVAILWQRAHYIRLSILLACVACFGASMLILLLFLSALLMLEVSLVLATIFVLTMLCLSCSLLFFFLEVNMTLSALKIEMEHYDKKHQLMESMEWGR